MVKPISAKIHLISVNSDLLFLSNEDKFTFEKLKKIKKKCTHSEVNSIHGHDAFLIENEQIKNILRTIF
jgi:homoserine O-acetyltransferase